MSRLFCRGYKRYKAVRRPICGCLGCWMKFKFRRKPVARPRQRKHEYAGVGGDLISKGGGDE